jgi:hypothetical protein
VGADTFRFQGFPATFTVVPPTSASWDTKATSNGLTTSSGLYGDSQNWSFLVFAAGDVDNNPADAADTWLVASSDGEIAAACPSSGGVTDHVAAGEPFNSSNDVDCN